ncbi:MAG: PAS domain S-box protein [Gemmatimonadota bacterium]
MTLPMLSFGSVILFYQAVRSANFSSIATDEKGVIQIFNVGAERMFGYTAAEVMNKVTPGKPTSITSGSRSRSGGQCQGGTRAT